MVASHLQHVAWAYLSEPDGYRVARLAASLGLLVNIGLKAVNDKEYEGQIRRTLASIKLNERDLSLYLAGFARGITRT